MPKKTSKKTEADYYEDPVRREPKTDTEFADVPVLESGVQAGGGQDYDTEAAARLALYSGTNNPPPNATDTEFAGDESWHRSERNNRRQDTDSEYAADDTIGTGQQGKPGAKAKPKGRC